MVKAIIDYVLADKREGTLSVEILCSRCAVRPIVNFTVRKDSWRISGAIEGLRPQSIGAYSLLSCVVFECKEKIRDSIGNAPVGSMSIRFYDASEEGRESRHEHSTMLFVRLGNGVVMARAEGVLCEGEWELRLEDSCANLPWQIIKLCGLC